MKRTGIVLLFWFTVVGFLADNTTAQEIAAPIILDQGDMVYGAVWNADETQILTWGGKSVKTWTAEGVLLHSFSTDDYLQSASWNRDESLILVWGGSSVLIWNVDGTARARLEHENVMGARWNEMGTRILSYGQDNTARMWDSEGRLLTTFVHDYWVVGATWNGAEDQILTWSFDNTARLWDTDGNLLATFEHDKRVLKAEFVADDSQVLTLSVDHTIKLWSVSGERVWTATHPDTPFLASDHMRHSSLLSWAFEKVFLWDFATGALITTLVNPSDVSGAMWIDDDTKIISWTIDSTLSIWSLDDKPPLTLPVPHRGREGEVIWNPREKQIVIVVNAFMECQENCRQAVYMWGLDGQLRATLEHPAYIYGALFSPSFDQLLTWSKDNSARIWTLEGELLAVLQHDGSVVGARWNSDGTQVLTWSDEDQKVKIWNT
ncbi:MAG: hypothetical protein JNJ61_17120 [Anaerolineae bacterium]|nr:hypothetical protein [Anaerolineae bacterium]